MARLAFALLKPRTAECQARPGRGDHWLKAKGVLRQEFIILGYIPSTAAKGTVGALLLGYFDQGTLMYAGRVGTGYSGDQARWFRKEFDKIASAKPKLGNTLPAGAEKSVRWAKPQLVGEIAHPGSQLRRAERFREVVTHTEL